MWRTFLSGTFASASIYRVPAVAKSMPPDTVLMRYNSNIKMTKQLKKMFDRRSGPKKKKIFPGPVNLGISSSQDLDKCINIRRKRQYTEGQKRRAQQVGRVMYDNIVHLINSGELSTELAAFAVEIVKVKVIPDFTVANVYWLSSGSREDDTVQTLLSENAGQLRHLLTSLHVLGSIPRINFIRDDSQAHYLEVQSLLESADFGPDFVPTRLDSSIRDIMQVSKQDGFSEDMLQEDFNTLNISLAGGFTGHKELGFEERSACGSFKEDEKTTNCSSGLKSYASQSFDGATNTLSATFNRMEVEDEKPLGLKASCSLPSSLEIEQLSSQYLPEFNKSADRSKKDFESVNGVFRDDLYKVPHTEILNKVLIRKQKAGHRPSRVIHAGESETVHKVESVDLKTSFQKKQKLKGRLKMQSDYCGTDFLEMNHVDDYTIDDGAFDGEVDGSELPEANINPKTGDKN